MKSAKKKRLLIEVARKVHKKNEEVRKGYSKRTKEKDRGDVPHAEESNRPMLGPQLFDGTHRELEGRIVAIREGLCTGMASCLYHQLSHGLVYFFFKYIFC